MFSTLFLQFINKQLNTEKSYCRYLNIQTCSSNTVFALLVPRVTPGRVNGGGGGRSELVITWEVNLYSNTKHLNELIKMHFESSAPLPYIFFNAFSKNKPVSNVLNEKYDIKLFKLILISNTTCVCGCSFMLK